MTTIVPRLSVLLGKLQRTRVPGSKLNCAWIRKLDKYFKAGKEDEATKKVFKMTAVATDR